MARKAACAALAPLLRLRMKGSSPKPGERGFRKIAFFGAPGVGKGTFASRVAPIMGIPTISTGDILRAEIKAGTPLGKQVEEINGRGDLVPDDLVTQIVADRLKEPDCADGYILDGYPRTTQQAEDFEKLHQLDVVVDFELPEWALVAKLAGRRLCETCGRQFNVAEIEGGGLSMPPLLPHEGMCETCDDDPPLEHRPDDKEAVVEKRLKVYNTQTAPLIDFYADRDLLLTFKVQKGLADMNRLLGVLGLPEDYVEKLFPDGA